ncbi:hypothetical protein Cabther_A1938 [Chloracidobacterium thermophilum B]|uniref:Uncharacterized protein n=1 Tax=Chloracidobacterium thermophilum (strain B) TaxID=981222 RepID=G2LHM0_CHLTF|nr:hypothetical protein Cabther_A1938 [Chloracidobacterium thermophilum B]
MQRVSNFRTRFVRCKIEDKNLTCEPEPFP